MEIKLPLRLDDRQATLLDMHSVFNILNVIQHEVTLMRVRCEGRVQLTQVADHIALAIQMLSNPALARSVVDGIDGLIHTIENGLDEACAVLPVMVRKNLEPHRANLHNIYRVLRIRAGEVLTRLRWPDTWVEHHIEDLKGNFVEFLHAVEKNSHGRYQIVNNVALQGDSDYLITFDISSEFGDTLSMPIVFQDVMRDLLANARKYTAPGGRIESRLHASKAGLHFFVSDNGVGIPNDAIEQVIQFGGRGSNVRHQVTRGGGFGLTKAYAVTLRHQGRMWIESSADVRGKHGTRIDIRLPSPGHLPG